MFIRSVLIAVISDGKIYYYYQVYSGLNTHLNFYLRTCMEKPGTRYTHVFSQWHYRVGGQNFVIPTLKSKFYLREFLCSLFYSPFTQCRELNNWWFLRLNWISGECTTLLRSTSVGEDNRESQGEKLQTRYWSGIKDSFGQSSLPQRNATNNLNPHDT